MAYKYVSPNLGHGCFWKNKKTDLAPVRARQAALTCPQHLQRAESLVDLARLGLPSPPRPHLLPLPRAASVRETRHPGRADLLCGNTGMFGFASNFATAQTTEQLAATSATACYKRPDQHVSQVAATQRACTARTVPPLVGCWRVIVGAYVL